MWKSVRNVLASSCAFLVFGTVGADDCTPGGGGGTPDAAVDAPPATGQSSKTILLILLHNQNWSTIKSSGAARYIRTRLLPMASHAENYKTPAGNHPSEPNYIWLVAGTNFGIASDADPAKNHITSDANLGWLMEGAGVSWKSYQ